MGRPRGSSDCEDQQCHSKPFRHQGQDHQCRCLQNHSKHGFHQSWIHIEFSRLSFEGSDEGGQTGHQLY
ncbi:unnamed protein product [Caenorhabditis brenneri]